MIHFAQRATLATIACWLGASLVAMGQTQPAWWSATRSGLEGAASPIVEVSTGGKRYGFIVDVSPDGRWFLVSADRGVIVYDRLHDRLDEIMGRVVAPLISFANDNLRFALLNRHLELWELENREWKRKWQKRDIPRRDNYEVDFSADGDWIVAALGQPALQVWSARTGNIEWTMEADGVATSARFARDGSRIALGLNGRPHVWSWPGRDTVFESPGGLAVNWGMEFVGADELLYAGSFGSTPDVLNLVDPKRSGPWQCRDYAGTLSVSPDEHFLILADRFKFHVIDLLAAARVASSPELDRRLTSVAASRNAHYVSTGSIGKAALWDVRKLALRKLPQPIKFDECSIDALWESLVSENPSERYLAYAEMMDRGGAALPELRAIWEKEAMNAHRVPIWLTELDADSLRTSTAALTRLQQFGWLKPNLLAAAVGGDMSFEARVEVHSILALQQPLALGQIRDPGLRRAMYLVRLLDEIHSHDAREFLDRLASTTKTVALQAASKQFLERW